MSRTELRVQAAVYLQSRAILELYLPGGRERSRLSVPISRNVSSLDEHRRRRRYLGVGPKAALDDRQGGDLVRVRVRVKVLGLGC